MLSKDFFLFIYKAAYMQRWNDHLRPIDLYELDKQAHKMIIAYILGKLEENNGSDIDWTRIIESGIFEFLQRIALTDMKPSLFYKIKKDKRKYRELNDFVVGQLSQYIGNIDDGKFLERFKEYLYNDTTNIKKFDINKKILKAAHFLSTKWEFEIIQGYNRRGYQIHQIKNDMLKREQSFNDLASVKELYFSSSLQKFMNLCGELRYQIRWNQLYRIPKTSVLGHMLIVAVISYFFSLKIGACDTRIFNNFYTGLFHDLPEVLTRDVISPIKTSVSGLDAFIKDYEQEEMENVYNLVPYFFTDDLKRFTENEFSNTAFTEVIKRFSDDIPQQYNKNEFSPRDGGMIKIADKLAALIEAYLTLENGINNKEIKRAIINICDVYKNCKLYNLPINDFFMYFNNV